LLGYDGAEDFARVQLAGLQPYPRYYAFMGRINTLGPTPPPRQTVPVLTPAEVRALGDTVHVVDARRRTAFAASHIPGALGVELRDDFATWVGWLLPFNAPIVLVLDSDQEREEAMVQLARIGFDQVRGVLAGMAAWQQAGYDTASYQTVDTRGFAQAVRDGRARQVLDVRAPEEWDAGSLPGALHSYVPDLLGGAPAELGTDMPVWVVCATGFRASIAAGLLEQRGYRPIVLAHGGVTDVQEHHLPVPAAGVEVERGQFPERAQR
jgi:hydroxyacylglutathione hydrolase